MQIVQLLEIAKLSESSWLTLWHVQARRKLSVELRDRSPAYRIGEIFEYRENGRVVSEVLKPVRYNPRFHGRLVIPVPGRRVSHAVVSAIAKRGAQIAASDVGGQPIDPPEKRRSDLQKIMASV
jgi:hypothetical protein